MYNSVALLVENLIDRVGISEINAGTRNSLIYYLFQLINPNNRSRILMFRTPLAYLQTYTRNLEQSLRNYFNYER